MSSQPHGSRPPLLTRNERRVRRKRRPPQPERTPAPLGDRNASRASPALEAYYMRQIEMFRDEHDRQAFFRVLRVPLPSCFRLTVTHRFPYHLRQRLEREFVPLFEAGDLPSACEEAVRAYPHLAGEPLRVQAPFALPWYPDRLAWQVDVPRAILRKLPALRPFHQFLVAENVVGGMNRQEAVSMLPPLLLRARPGHRILDMCAAPGSKTAQLVDMLAAQPSSADRCVLVANDVDRQRCWMLVHQLKRFACPFLVVTNYEAASIPLRAFPHRFDRVLCDVPCSGDGTLRKSPDVWHKWSVKNGNGLHALQVRIALRGMALLVDDGTGLMTYSTCSLNPVENEAVVAELLRQMGADGAELVDVSEQLPALRRRRGLRHWAPSRDEPASLQPPSSAEQQWMHLERCVRVMPHDQNTGGFFVAVLRRLARTGREDAEMENGDGDASGAPDAATAAVSRGQQRRMAGPVDPPLEAVADAADGASVLDPIGDFYGIDRCQLRRHLYRRESTAADADSASTRRRLYWMSGGAADVAEALRSRPGRLLAAGIRAFELCEMHHHREAAAAAPPFRIAHEAVPLLRPHLNVSRFVAVCRDAWVQLLLHDGRGQPRTSFPLERLRDADARRRLQDMPCGPLVIEHVLDAERDEDAEPLPPVRNHVVAWKTGANTLSLFTPVDDLEALQRLYGVSVERAEREQEERNPS